MTLSVVLASCRSAALVGAAVRALRTQCTEHGAELIVARSTPDGIPDPDGLFDGCMLVTCRAGATIPEIRGMGMMAATGEWVLLTEDNCVPRGNWVEQLTTGLADAARVVGGTMGNAHPDHAVDTGAFYAEYGFFGEAREAPGRGASPFVTGANVAYHRSVVADAAIWARAGEWEGNIHHRLAERGVTFALVRDAVVELNERCEFGAFSRDRFTHGRRYASARAVRWSWGQRALMACATALLPPLQTWRAWQSAGRRTPGVFLTALPYTVAFFSAWAAGEAAGYLRGGPAASSAHSGIP
jgi:hypothetical protein